MIAEIVEPEWAAPSGETPRPLLRLLVIASLVAALLAGIGWAIGTQPPAMPFTEMLADHVEAAQAGQVTFGDVTFASRVTVVGDRLYAWDGEFCWTIRNTPNAVAARTSPAACASSGDVIGAVPTLPRQP